MHWSYKLMKTIAFGFENSEIFLANSIGLGPSFLGFSLLTVVCKFRYQPIAIEFPTIYNVRFFSSPGDLQNLQFFSNFENSMTDST